MATPKANGRNNLRNNFGTGQKPTGANFADLIESFLNLSDDDITVHKVGSRKYLGFGTDEPKSPVSIRENSGRVINLEEDDGKSNWHVTLEGDTPNKGLHLRHDGQSDHLFLQKDGKTGLGTRQAKAKLHLSDDNPDIKIEHQSGSIHLEQSAQGAYMGFSGNQNKIIIGHQTSGNKKPSENGKKHLVVTKNGNVGLGTDEPAEKLHLTEGKILIGSKEDANLNTLLTNKSVQGQSGNGPGPFVINEQGGNVGIGISEPTAALHIESDQDEVLHLKGGNSSQIRLQAKNSNLAEIKFDENNEIHIQSASGESLAKVDIHSKLEISGDEESSLVVQDQDENQVLITAASIPSLKLRNKDGMGAQFRFTEEAQLRISDQDEGFMQAMIIDGNVGIGTDDPKAQLHIRGAIRSGAHFEGHDGNVIRDALFNYTHSEQTDPLYLVTNLTKGSDVMYRLTIEGYNYQESAAINTEIVGYTGTDDELPSVDEGEPVALLEENILNEQIINHCEGVSISQHYTNQGLLILQIANPTEEAPEAPSPPAAKPYHLGFSLSVWFINEKGTEVGIDLTVTQDLSEATV